MLYWAGLFTLCVFALGYLIGKTDERKNQEQLRRIAERPAPLVVDKPVDKVEVDLKIKNPTEVEYNHSYGDPEVVKWIDDNQAKRGDS